MRWIASLVALAVAVVAMGCTITVKPIPQKKSVKRSNHSRHHASSRTIKRTTQPQKPQAADRNIKETWWIENYKKLQSAHGDYTISDDAKIEPLPDGRFRVPDSVLSHYQDMLLARPTPKP